MNRPGASCRVPRANLSRASVMRPRGATLSYEMGAGLELRGECHPRLVAEAAPFGLPPATLLRKTRTARFAGAICFSCAPGYRWGHPANSWGEPERCVSTLAAGLSRDLLTAS